MNKYFYKNIPLKKYCEENNLDYDVILSRIQLIKKDEKNASLTNEEIIKKAISSQARNIYMYKGMKLSHYCREHGLNHVSIVSTISFLRKRDEYKKYTNQELLEIVMNKSYKKEPITKYMYKGVPLSQYCKENNLRYTTVLARVSKLKTESENSGLTDEEITEKAIVMETYTKYFYKGVSLYEYCKQNGLNYHTIVKRIFRAKKYSAYSNMSDEELIEMAVSKKIEEIGYVYKGMPLSKYCFEHNINYETLKNKMAYVRKKEQYKNFSTEQIIDIVINNSYQRTNINADNCKYKYNGIPLSVHCKKVGLKLANVRHRIFEMRHNDQYSHMDADELVKIAVNVEQEKTLKVMKEKKVKQISEELNINYDNLNALSRRMSLNRAVNIIKYYGDKEDELGNKFVSSSTINYLQLLLDKVKNSSDEISVYELFRLYKCKLYDTRGIIVYRKNKDINDLIDNLYKNYNEKISNLSKDDFVNIVEFAYIDSLDVLELTSEKDFDRNVKKYVQEKFKNYISIYSDYGANTSKRVKFDSLKIDAEDKKFIILRINKKYSYNALAKYYGVKVNDIIEKEKKILKKISKTIERKARKN